MDPKPAPKFEFRRWGGLCRSVLNGVVGDHLSRSGNPLAIEMAFQDDAGEPTAAPITSRVVVLVHGLTNRETIFEFRDAHAGNYGVRLHQDHGFTPFFLRYNTGLPIEENGRRFAELLEELVQGYPGPVDELVLLGFSMGGLVSRHAQRHAREEELTWLSKLSRCIYLGTPHEGARLERLGRFAGTLLRALPGEAGERWAARLDMRSAGIQDLGDGLAGDAPDTYHPEATHHFVSGSLTARGDGLVDAVLGDGLVTQDSACPASTPEGSVMADFAGVSHFPLAYSDAVYGQIAAWVAGGPAPRAREAECPREVPARSPKSSTRQMVAGALDLAGSAVEGISDAVQDAHLSIAAIPHRVLDRVPPVRVASAGVEAVHRGVAEVAYGAVRGGGTLLRAAASLVEED